MAGLSRGDELREAAQGAEAGPVAAAGPAARPALMEANVGNPYEKWFADQIAEVVRGLSEKQQVAVVQAVCTRSVSEVLSFNPRAEGPVFSNWFNGSPEIGQNLILTYRRRMGNSEDPLPVVPVPVNEILSAMRLVQEYLTSVTKFIGPAVGERLGFGPR